VIIENAVKSSVSHNGQYICYQNCINDVVSVFDLTTENSWSLTESIASSSGPSINVDNTKVIFDIWDTESKALTYYTVPLEGGAIEPFDILNVGVMIGFPHYSPDGSLILYTDFSSNSNNLTLIDANTGEHFDLFESNTYRIYKAQWSPDGSKICYQMKNSDGKERIYIKDMSEIIADYQNIQTPVESSEPTDFGIIGNFPNPFNPITEIEFSLPETGFTELVIYNVMGQKVRKLVAGTMTSGIHSMVWDGRNNLGQTVSAGVYMTRLQMGDTVAMRRLTLIK
jgi:Tol biopolymer transport system component